MVRDAGRACLLQDTPVTQTDGHGLSAVGFQVNNPDGSTFSISQAIVPNDRQPIPADFAPYPASVADLTDITDALVQANYMFPVTHIKIVVSAGSGVVEFVAVQAGVVGS